MIIDKEIEITATPKNLKELKKYKNDIKIHDTIMIPIEYISKNSHKKIHVKCDNCEFEKIISYFSYNRNIKDTNMYTCQKCSGLKSKVTNLKKYGVEYPIQSNEIKKKRKNNNLKKYSVDESFKLKSVILKIKETKELKYGDENYNNTQKIKETKKLKYGDENYNNRIKSNETCLINYGVINPSQSELIKNKKINTFTKNYNIDNYTKSEIYKNKNINYLKSKYENIKIININDNNVELECDCNKNHNYKINKKILRNRIIYDTILCTICNPISSYTNSGYEIQLQDFIKNNYNRKIIENNRKIISPLELDIYLPDLNIAFEFNGSWWHNELHKEYNYHLNKTEECEKINIQLIHIYEYDWNYKQDIIKSMILNYLGKISNHIPANETEIKEIYDNKIIKEFLNNNHIKGFSISKIKLGLYYNNELVSLMIFSKYKLNFELLLFCNKLNTDIIGGENKLFEYFIRNYNPSKITTYIDRSFNQSKLYETIGFKYESKAQPDYSYIINGIKYNKLNFTKNKLIQQGFDKNKTEHEIMLKRKIYRIYDSGKLKYCYKK